MEESRAAGPDEVGAIVDRIIAREAGRRGALLPVLHAVQAALGWIPEAAVAAVARGLNLSRAEVHGVVGFYHDFRRRPPPRHVVRLCRAEACQARGARRVEAALAARLGVAMGGVRDDGQAALEPAYCLGLCAIGPSALIDERPVGRLDEARIEAIAHDLGLGERRL